MREDPWDFALQKSLQLCLVLFHSFHWLLEDLEAQIVTIKVQIHLDRSDNTFCSVISVNLTEFFDFY